MSHALEDTLEGWDTPHEHEHTEFLYVLDGGLRNQGRVMKAGDAYAGHAGG